MDGRLSIDKMEKKDYIKELYDGSILVNSRFVFDSQEEALIVFPELKNIKVK